MNNNQSKFINYLKQSQNNLSSFDNSHKYYLNSKKFDIITMNRMGVAEASSYNKIIPNSNKIERLKKIIDRNQREIEQKLSSSTDMQTLRAITSETANEVKSMFKAKTPFSFRQSEYELNKIKGNVEIINNELQRVKTIAKSKLKSAEPTKLHESYDSKQNQNDLDLVFSGRHVQSTDEKINSSNDMNSIVSLETYLKSKENNLKFTSRFSMAQPELPQLKNIRAKILGSYGEVLHLKNKKNFFRHTIE